MKIDKAKYNTIKAAIKAVVEHLRERQDSPAQPKTNGRPLAVVSHGL